jgi:TolA-binding protein
MSLKNSMTEVIEIKSEEPLSKRRRTGSFLVIDLTNIDAMPVDIVVRNLATMADIAAAGIQPPNLPPAFANMPQQLQQIGQTQQQQNQQMQQTQQTLQQTQQTLQQTQQTQQQLLQHIQQLADDIARVNNRASAMGDHPLIPLRVGVIPVPISFPVDLNSLRNMPNPSLTQCLQYYGLAVGGSVSAKRLRLARHIGALRML